MVSTYHYIPSNYLITNLSSSNCHPYTIYKKKTHSSSKKKTSLIPFSHGNIPSFDKNPCHLPIGLTHLCAPGLPAPWPWRCPSQRPTAAKSREDLRLAPSFFRKIMIGIDIHARFCHNHANHNFIFCIYFFGMMTYAVDMWGIFLPVVTLRIYTGFICRLHGKLLNQEVRNKIDFGKHECKK